MPRKSRSTAPAPVAPVETRPFADGSAAPFAALPEADRKSIAERIAADKASGLSGNELRARYGERLTGPARRKVLRAFGFDGGAFIARSYDAYRDGDFRNGSRHAREHGALAAQRRAEAADAAAATAELPTMRKALREAGSPVPSVRKGDATALRSAYAALLLSPVAPTA